MKTKMKLVLAASMLILSLAARSHRASALVPPIDLPPIPQPQPKPVPKPVPAPWPKIIDHSSPAVSEVVSPALSMPLS